MPKVMGIIRRGKDEEIPFVLPQKRNVKILTKIGRQSKFLFVQKFRPISAVIFVTSETNKEIAEYQVVTMRSLVTRCYKTGQMLQNLGGFLKN